MNNGPKFVETNEEEKLATEHSYINLKLTTDNVDEYKPRFGLKVMDSINESLLQVLDHVIATGRTQCLHVEVDSVTIGADYRSDDSVDDPELDALLGKKDTVVPMFNSQGKQRKSEPVLFWINYKVTTPAAKNAKGEDAVIRTDSTVVTAKAPRQFLADLLKVSKTEMALIAEVDVVRCAHAPEEEYTVDLSAV